MIQLWK